MINKIKIYLCGMCNNGIWYEWEGPEPYDGRAEHCGCTDQSIFTLIKLKIKFISFLWKKGLKNLTKGV